MKPITAYSLAFCYIDLIAFDQQEHTIQTMCIDWIQDLFKMNAYVESDIIDTNILIINTMYSIGVIKRLKEDYYFIPSGASIDSLIDLSEFKRLPETAKTLAKILINAYYKKHGKTLFALLFNTFKQANMLNCINGISRKQTIDEILEDAVNGASLL